MHHLSYKTLFIIILFLLIPIVLLLRINQKAVKISAAWWNDSWNYRQAIDINNVGVAQTNVYITLTIGTSDTSRFQTDAGDIRFTNNSNLLNYYLVSGVGTSSTVIHINFPSLPVGNSTIYLYYGNPSASNGFSSVDFSTAASNTTPTTSSEEVGGGPIAYWKFDEGVGTTTYDSTGNQQNARLTGTTLPAWTTEDQCVSGKCLYSSGASSLTLLNNSIINFTTNSFSVSLWIKPQDFTYPKTTFALIKGSGPYIDGPGHEGWSIGDSYDARGSYFVLNDGTSKVNSLLTFNTGSQPPDFLNKWTHLVYVFNRTANRIYAYVNGVQQNNSVDISSVTGSIANASNLSVGLGTGWTYKGFFDDIKIYPYARTAAQIKQDYASGLAGVGNAEGANVNMGSNSSKSLSDGLVGYWKFDEGTGTTTADSSGNSNLATFGTGSSAPAWATGKYGVGLSFDRSNDYLTSALTNVNSTAGGYNSVSYWMYWKGNSTDIVFSLGSYYDLWFSSATCFGFNTGAGEAYGFNPSSPSIANRWVHVVANFYNGAYTGKNEIYIDGVKQTLTQCAGSGQSKTLTSSLTLILGNLLVGGGYSFGGLIDEFRIYNRALNQTEVTALYEYAPPPIAYWKMDEGTGTTAFDSSGNSNNGVLGTGTSSPAWTSGKIGKALSFDGSNDYVDLGQNSGNLLEGYQFTVGFWFKPLVAMNSITGLISKDQNNPYSFSIRRNSVSTNLEVLRSGTTLPTTISPQNNTWQYLTYVFDSSVGQKIYLNGILNSSDSNTALVTSNNDVLYLGLDYQLSQNRNFNGLIDDVKIYNYARSQKQILEDMSAANQNKMLAWYKFDEGAGTIANNSGIGGTLYHADFAIGNSSPTWGEGRSNKGLIFNGTTNYATINSRIGPTGDFSISSWVKPSSKSIQVIVGTNQNSGGLRLSNTHITFGPSGTYVAIWTGARPTNDVWHHIAVSINRTTDLATLFVDGINKGTQSVASYVWSTFNEQFSYIGKDYCSATDCWFSGTIDEVKIYNYALTLDDIKTDYNQGASFIFGGNTSQTIGATTTSLDYCLPGDTTYCAAPVAEWKMDEGVGTTAYDTSGNSNSAIFGGTSPTWAIGKIGKGLIFNNSYLSISDNSVLSPGTNNYTVNTWFKTSYNYSSSKGWLLSNYGSVTNNVVDFEITTANKLLCYYRDGSGNSAQTITTTTVNDNQWHFGSCIKNGNSINLYIDGVNVGTTGYNASLGTIDTTGMTKIIGAYARDVTLERFNGSLDHIRVYNYARTAAQVAYDYNKGKPIAWYKMDECQGNIIHDSSGVGNTGTISIGASGTQNSLGTCQVGTSAAWTAGSSGKINSSLNFDGNDDYISLANNGSLNTSNAISISAWVNPSATNGIRMILATSQYAFRISNGKFETFMSLGGNRFSTSIDDVNIGTWQHLVATYNKDSGDNVIHLYLNGKEVSYSQQDNSGGASLPTPISNIFIAKRLDGYFYAGQIDDVRIYNYSLTSEQIKQIYNGGAMNFN